MTILEAQAHTGVFEHLRATVLPALREKAEKEAKEAPGESAHKY